MIHPLQQIVRGVRRRSRQLLVLYGVSCFLAVGLLAALAAGLADYLVRFRDPGVRIIVSASTLVLLIWSFFRFVVATVHRRYSNLQVARYIERRFPELRDRLSSAIEFLEQSERASGSVDLRRNMVGEASVIARRLDLFDSIDPTTPRRALLGLTVAVLFLVGVCMCDQQSSWLAAQRLAVPWSVNAWPRRHALALAAPPRQVAAGQDFEIELIDRKGRLPDEVTAEYWFDGDDATQRQSRQMKQLGQRMVDQLANVTRSFRVRAFGGDDDTMQWHAVKVVEPPRVLEFEIRVQPPKYSGRPSEKSGRHLRVFEGTQLTLIARANKPLRSVRWRGTTRHQPDQVTARLNEDGLGFSWPTQPFVTHESGTFWFELTDRDGVTNDLQLRCEMQVVQDSPPTVSVESPGLDAVLTSRAVVQLKATIKDDLAIDAVSLHFRDQRVQLDTVDNANRTDERPAAAGGDLRVIEFAWDLGEMLELTPGDTVEFHVAASDFRPQFGQSATRRLSVVSSDEFERRSNQRQTAIRQQLEEALRVQRSAGLQVRALALQLEETGQLRDADVDLLQATEMQQRTVRSLLQNQQDGVQTLLQSLLADARSNRVQSGSFEREMTSLLQQIDQLAAAHLTSIEQGLREALADARGRPIEHRLGTRLSATGQAQDVVVTRLERMLDEFEHRESYRHFAREVAQIRNQQDALGHATRDMDTVGKTRGDLTTEQTATLGRLALSQRELARRFDRLQGTMQGVADSLADADPAISATLERALQVARASAVSGLMREAAEGVQSNQLGRVSEIQERIQAGLDGVIDRLSNRDSRDSNGQAQPPDILSRLAPQILDLVDRQEAVARETEELSRIRAEQGGRLGQLQLVPLRQLASDQRELGQETTSLAEAVAAAEVFAFGLRSASREMLRAAGRLEQAMTGQATIAAQATALRQLRDLHEALRQTAQSQADGPAASPPQPPHESASAGLRLSELRLLKRLQLEINRRTTELHERRDAMGSLPVELQRELNDLMAEQGRLAAVVLRLGNAKTN